MPELAEVKIMAEYINDICSEHIFNAIILSEHVADRQPLVQSSDLEHFSIRAESRGKELLLYLKGYQGEKKISVAMGMTGNWQFIPSLKDYCPKHAHLIFSSWSDESLCLIDVRRFAKWGYTDGFSKKRGPCPLQEHGAFRHHVLKGVNKNLKIFEKPIFEIMMDQKWFNGIGNYLRSEILFRLSVDPFQSAKDIILQDIDGFFQIIKTVIEESYIAGGGELKDWDNPYTRGYGRGRINQAMKVDAPTNFRDWLQCYQKGASIIDSKKRKFWFDERYLSSANIYSNKD